MDVQPLILKKHRLSPIWTLPLIALGLCLWIFFKSYQEAGVEVTIFFDDASGITPGKTQVIARGIPVGLVREVQADLHNQRIRTLVSMDKEMEEYLVEDTLFWVVRPEISGTRIEGLETILSGSYIGVQAGSSQQESRIYEGLNSPPPISEEAPGLHLKLRAQTMRSIQMGSGIYYRNIQIGSVQNYSLEGDKNIIINLHIKPQFTHLVREGSRFANGSGLTLSGKLTNLKLHMESLTSLLMGGLVLYTPEELKNTPQAKNGETFTLYKDVEAAKFGINMTLKLASGAGIAEGVTKVRYRGLDAGIVEKIIFNNDERHTVTAHILLDPRAEIILKEGTRFWLVEPKINVQGFQNLSTLLSGPYITFIPGTGDFKDHFEILPSEPPSEPLRPGKSFFLKAEKAHSFTQGAPVLFNSIKVGEIVSMDLTQDSQALKLKIYIYDKYTHLVDKNSVFWNTSGIKANVSLAGLQVETGTLSTILKGGISFTTPPLSSDTASPAEAGDHFSLYGSYREAVQQVDALHPPGLYFQVKAKNLGPYKVGSPILYKKVEVGEVLGFSFSKKYQDVLIDCFIHEPYVNMVNSKSRFFDYSGMQINGNLAGISMQTGSMESILVGGIGFTTPYKAQKIKKNTIFTLYPTKEAAQMADYIKLTVVFKDSRDLKVGAPVKFKGVKVGKVTEIRFSKDLSSIVAGVRVKRGVSSFFKETTEIWLETPKFRLAGIKNPETLISGPYLTFSPGTGKRARSFVALEQAPMKAPPPEKGLNLLLISKNLGSINIDSPIYFRQVKVGKVTGFKLSETFQEVHVDINIAPAYTPIIRENTRFWNASGTKIEGGLFSGVKVSTESLEAMLTGGIALATPEEDMGEPVAQGHSFRLHKHAKSEWLDWTPEIVILEKEKEQQVQKK